MGFITGNFQGGTVDYKLYEYLEVTRESPVPAVSFNRPESLNAMNGEFHSEASLRCICVSIG
uniref:Uncharacterized protein n=1 Tax=Candidatus Kentrum sp. UNK TaxID=2126344 RepID=A0A451AMF8_9GAMM|nr:MAG: hypothetical protein BECKUNK1418G_GA0071005_11316 [Candidatus Kentron sp. UNK]VFK72575.1 MAG: hypothetical protein BECKUNK1418H_GA0071006_11237 [Candidatus Kentron sp. UNK]